LNLFDTHSHIDFEKFDADRDAMLKRAQAAGVGSIVIPAVDADSIRRALRLVQQYDWIYMAVGVHPNSTAGWSSYHELNNLRDWVQMGGDKVVSIGEIGLDYHWDRSPKDIQAQAFRDQLALAKELKLPVIIHNRDASADTLPILEEWAKDLPPELEGRPGVLHSFSAPPRYAERALAAGFYLGFTGPVTYKNADDLRAVARRVPDDKLLIETDAPFLTPKPYRGKRNEPAYVQYVAEKLAEVRGISVEDLATQTTQNAYRLFGLA